MFHDSSASIRTGVTKLVISHSLSNNVCLLMNVY